MIWWASLFFACAEPPPIDEAWIAGAAPPADVGGLGEETVQWLAEGDVVCGWTIALTVRSDLPPCADADDRPCDAAFTGTRSDSAPEVACDAPPPRLGTDTVGVGWMDDYRIAGQSDGARGLWWDGEGWAVTASGVSWDGTTLRWRFPTPLPETAP